MNRSIITFAFASLFALPAMAADEHANHSMAGMPGMGASAAPAKAALSEGIVKKVDKASGRITLTHGPLVNLDMPGMTMAFAVANPGFLGKVKVGDKVRFRAEDHGGVLTVVRIEAAH